MRDAAKAEKPRREPKLRFALVQFVLRVAIERASGVPTVIWNIIDSRKRPYRWRQVNAVIENIEHDNSVEGADIFDEQNPGAPLYEEKNGVLLHEAIEWAESAPGKVTLYLYDDGI